ncbi:hypothetical protein niasHS_014411 [Heterodera schachtii]|uniref:Uncharacterized protein n=1 Tax=Heterodera schachtii TaxID=97005 RepID=A0ABD2IBZ7_HETSC
MSDLVVRSFDYTTKLVSDTDCSPTIKFLPLIQLRLHCEDRQKCGTVRTFEFTLPEAHQFLLSLKAEDDDNSNNKK